MIYDSLKNIATYKGLYKNLDIAIDYLLANDLSQLQEGQHSILGEDIYVNIVQSKLIDEEEGVYELHQQYLDLHINFGCPEIIRFAKYKEEDVTKQYDSDGDYALLRGDSNSMCVLDEESFVVCMLGEPHMPCVKVDEKDFVKKAIIKIRV